MSVTDTVYKNTDEDYQEICAFLNRFSSQDPDMLWESGRMNFWRYNVHADKGPGDPFFRENVHLWRSDLHGIVGLCISEYGENDLFIEVKPEYHKVYPDIFRWINNTWAVGREEIEVDIFGDDRKKIDWLKADGYSFKCHFENKRIYNLDEIDLGYQLENGFTIQAFLESADYAGRVALVQSAFENPNYAEHNLTGLMASPDYIDEYNLIVVSPDRQPVAYCVGWHSTSNDHSGYIEPVGTHAAYRQRGFAKAVIRECFTRMKANGIKWAEIVSPAEPAAANFLYDSLSPQNKREVHRYSKRVSGKGKQER